MFHKLADGYLFCLLYHTRTRTVYDYTHMLIELVDVRDGAMAPTMFIFFNQTTLSTTSPLFVRHLKKKVCQNFYDFSE